MGPRRLAAVLVVVTLSAVALLARREVLPATARAPVPAAVEAPRVSPDRSAPSAESAPFVRAVDEAMASMHREHELDR